MHYTEFEKQVQSIFQVKIKDDYLNKLFQGVNSKLINLQMQLQEIKSSQQHNRNQNLLLPEHQETIKEQINTTVHPMMSRIDHLHLQIQQYNQNQKDAYASLQQAFKSMASERIQSFQQQRVNNHEQLRFLKQEIKRIVLRNQAIEKTLNDHIEDNSLKDEKYEFQIQSLWEAVNGSKGQQTKVQPKKTREAKHSIFKQLSQSKQSNQKEDNTQSSFRKGKINTKGVIQPRKSLMRQTFKVQSPRQSKTVEYACLLLKVQALEKKIQEFAMQKSSLAKFKNTSEQQIGSKQIMQNFEDKGQRIVIERKKLRNSNIGNRMNRCSIAKNQCYNSDIDNLSRDEYSDTYGASSQLKKVNQKLAQLKYKYTLLQENHEIVLNKISRVTQIESSLKDRMEQIQKMRVDLSTINEINMRFRKIQASYQQQQYKYVPNQTYTKDIKQIRDNVKDIEAKINKMANKGQVKEAFVFIQTKIKEMALVLTDKFQSQKEGALNKIKQVKCLTCDKECEEKYSYIRMSLNSAQCTRNIKTSNQFSRLKRKARVTQKKIKTQSNQNFQFSGNFIRPFE